MHKESDRSIFLCVCLIIGPINFFMYMFTQIITKWVISYHFAVTYFVFNFTKQVCYCKNFSNCYAKMQHYPFVKMHDRLDLDNRQIRCMYWLTDWWQIVSKFAITKTSALSYKNATLLEFRKAHNAHDVIFVDHRTLNKAEMLYYYTHIMRFTDSIIISLSKSIMQLICL